MSYVSLTPLDIVLAATLLFANGLISWGFRLRLEKSIAIAAVRMVVQLALIGVVLKFIFAQTSPAWTVVFALVMVSAAGVEVVARQHRGFATWRTLGLSTATLLFIGTFVTVLGVGAIISPDPWYSPRYILPILGMVLGNTMTAVALVLDVL
ncbi:MAG: ABC transporter permease, partial [Hyphomicrobium sp.]|nr:ABC transporter permease [Hyphomicrobium sp.]